MNKQAVVLDTDIGGDIDDFLALCFLLAHPRAKLVGISVYKGRKDQIGLVKWLLTQCDVDVPVGGLTTTPDDKRGVSNSQHWKIIEKWDGSNPKEIFPDMRSSELYEECLKKHPDCIIVTTGPLGNIYQLLSRPEPPTIQKSFTMGGYVSNLVHGRKRHPLTMQDQVCVPEFNFNGHVDGALALLSTSAIKEKHFISKNVTHSITFHREWALDLPEATSIAGKIFQFALRWYLERKLVKKLHDPMTAAIALDPSIATFIEVEIYREGGRWGSKRKAGTNQLITVDVDETKLKRMFEEL